MTLRFLAASVMIATTVCAAAVTAPKAGAQTTDAYATWSACVNTMPVGEPSLIVTGVVDVPTTAHVAALVAGGPGTAETLVLDVVVSQLPGEGLDVVTPREVSYVIRPYSGGYTAVVVNRDGEQIAHITEICELS